VVVFVTLAVATGCGATPSASESACEPYAAYQGHDGSTVTIFSSIRDVEADKMAKAWEPFQACTGIDIDYEGSAEFEATLATRVRSGTGPDIAVLPQPGLLAELVHEGLLQPASEQVRANATQWWPADWLRYATIDGRLYAAPLDANVKSFVWYSPKLFRKMGYAVPTTWEEMLALSRRMAADGIKPWCAGIESGAATGWPVTDWLEDTLLRTAGPEVYDRWVAHKIPFNDPRVVAALDQVGAILKNPVFVNGGYGGVDTIATTSFQEGGLPILEHKCAMHRQGSFYETWWPATATIGEDGDVYAFYLPPVDPAKGRPVLGGGTFTAVFADRPEVIAVAAYLSTPDFANSRARTGDAPSANRGLDPANLHSPVSRLSAQLLTDPHATLRFDGSDVMPASVGAGTFWAEMTDWINGKDSSKALTEIESSWPTS
jgi:alpha-glucoside transport system substrate-binding protein